MKRKPAPKAHAVTAPVLIPAKIAQLPGWWSALVTISTMATAIGAWTRWPWLLILAMIGSGLVVITYRPLNRAKNARIQAFVAAELARRKANP